MSFKVETFTQDGYAIDMVDSGLTINFVCEYPCRTCDDSTPTVCDSCYSLVDERFFFENQCLAECKSGYYEEV